MIFRTNLSKNIKKYLKTVNLLQEKIISNEKCSIQFFKSKLPDVKRISSLAVKFTNNEKNNNVKHNTKCMSCDKLEVQDLFKRKLTNLNISSNKTLFASLGLGAAYKTIENASPTTVIMQDEILEPARIQSEVVETSVSNAETSFNSSGLGGMSTTIETEPPPTVIRQDEILEPPSIPSDQVEETIVSNGKPSFNPLGLGEKNPEGFVQQCLDYLHISQDIPVQSVIAIGTVVVKVLRFIIVQLMKLPLAQPGTDSAGPFSQNLRTVTYVLRQFVKLSFRMKFPSAFLCYRIYTNLRLLVQAGSFIIPVVRYFYKGNVKGMQGSSTNMKITRTRRKAKIRRGAVSACRKSPPIVKS